MQDFSWNSSYLFGTDNESGWGERYFFTYFSEFNGADTSNYAIVEVTIFLTIFIISVIANISIVICVIR